VPGFGQSRAERRGGDELSAYYNEHDPFAAAWLRELIADGQIAPGDVDERSIADVTPADLVGYSQCHFFAGIGGWSLALRIAGWPDDQPVWTGSCPCQPFSAAGKGGGMADDRHLWPVWFRLIRECRPGVVFGEQVEAAIRHGWLDLVCDDLESEGYAVGAVGLPAASVGAPHIRQRLWFVADAGGTRTGRDAGGAFGAQTLGSCEGSANGMQFSDPSRAGGATVGVADRDTTRCGSRRAGKASDGGNAPWEQSSRLCDALSVADAEHAQRRPFSINREDERNWHDAGREETYGQFGTRREVHTVADANTPGQRIQRSCGLPKDDDTSQRNHADGCSSVGHASKSGLSHGKRNELSEAERHDEGRAVAESGRSPWTDLDWLQCRDGKARPTEPGLFPLAHGVSNRVGRLRGYGNAIVPQVAAAFIGAYLDTQKGGA